MTGVVGWAAALSTTEMAVISVETVGTGARPASALGRLERAILGDRRRAAHRGRVQRPIVGQPQRVDFLERRIEQDECLAGGVDPEDPAGRFGSGEEIARRREGERHDVGGARLVEARALAVGSDLVDDALVAGRGKEVARAIEGERPDVLVVGIEERSRRAIGARRGRSCRRATLRRRARCRAPARSRELRARSRRRTSRPCRPCRSSGPCPRCRCRPRAFRPRPATTVHRNGAAVSATSDVDGPRNTRPSLSMDRSSTSPFRKSLCVATVQNVGMAAPRPAQASDTSATSTRRASRGQISIFRGASSDSSGDGKIEI